jgi:hypothetical protein
MLLLQKLQRMMEPSGSRYSESQEGLLKVVAALGTTLTTAKAQMLLLGMLIARLGDSCARMRAAVASLLEGASARGHTHVYHPADVNAPCSASCRA